MIEQNVIPEAQEYVCSKCGGKSDLKKSKTEFCKLRHVKNADTSCLDRSGVEDSFKWLLKDKIWMCTQCRTTSENSESINDEVMKESESNIKTDKDAVTLVEQVEENEKNDDCQSSSLTLSEHAKLDNIYQKCILTNFKSIVDGRTPHPVYGLDGKYYPGMFIRKDLAMDRTDLGIQNPNSEKLKVRVQRMIKQLNNEKAIASIIKENKENYLAKRNIKHTRENKTNKTDKQNVCGKSINSDPQTSTAECNFHSNLRPNCYSEKSCKYVSSIICNKKNETTCQPNCLECRLCSKLSKDKQNNKGHIVRKDCNICKFVPQDRPKSRCHHTKISVILKHKYPRTASGKKITNTKVCNVDKSTQFKNSAKKSFSNKQFQNYDSYPVCNKSINFQESIDTISKYPLSVKAQEKEIEDKSEESKKLKLIFREKDEKDVDNSSKSLVHNDKRKLIEKKVAHHSKIDSKNKFNSQPDNHSLNKSSDTKRCSSKHEITSESRSKSSPYDKPISSDKKSSKTTSNDCGRKSGTSLSDKSSFSWENVSSFSPSVSQKTSLNKNSQAESLSRESPRKNKNILKNFTNQGNVIISTDSKISENEASKSTGFSSHEEEKYIEKNDYENEESYESYFSDDIGSLTGDSSIESCEKFLHDIKGHNKGIRNVPVDDMNDLLEYEDCAMDSSEDMNGEDFKIVELPCRCFILDEGGCDGCMCEVSRTKFNASNFFNKGSTVNMRQNLMDKIIEEDENSKLLTVKKKQNTSTKSEFKDKKGFEKLKSIIEKYNLMDTNNLNNREKEKCVKPLKYSKLNLDSFDSMNVLGKELGCHGDKMLQDLNKTMKELKSSSSRKESDKDNSYRERIEKSLDLSLKNFDFNKSLTKNMSPRRNEEIDICAYGDGNKSKFKKVQPTDNISEDEFENFISEFEYELPLLCSDEESNSNASSDIEEFSKLLFSNENESLLDSKRKISTNSWLEYLQ